MKFTSFGLSAPILKAVKNKRYETPTPIQAQAIPVIMKGRDVMGAAQTGTGKTAGFTLPILDKLSKGKKAPPQQARSLILTPTRELAAQVADSVETYGKHLSLRYAVAFGGVKINPQIEKLRRGVDILVATPGRLLDLYNQKAVKFNQLEVLVLDEADRMLDMGFIHDIKRIIAVLPKKRQSLMFSATFSADIRILARDLIKDPVEISVDSPNSTVEAVNQLVYPVDKSQKSALLAKLIEEEKWPQALIFTRTKHGANRLTRFLNKKKISAAAIHGNKSQGARTKALADFKSNKFQILVATDIAARGLDISQLPCVVNFNLPNIPEDYVHRIGRTGRAGAAGKAISLVCADEFEYLSHIEHLIKQILDRELIEGFEPVHRLPESSLERKPAKTFRNKKPRADHRNGKRSGTKPGGFKRGRYKPKNKVSK